jgi:phospholipase C
MRKKFESYYGKLLNNLLKIINPIKKIVISTDCEVHIFNNYHAVQLLKKYNYNTEYHLFNKYLKDINEGSVWADQDFKSIAHFYNPHMKRGLFGNNNSLNLTNEYYNKAIRLWKAGNKNKAMFYLGACVHIIQDLTISQHVKIRLLDGHRKYENYVKYTHDLVKEYIAAKEPILLNSPEEYIEYNAYHAIKIDDKVKKIPSLKHQFYHKTIYILPLAQQTTAGCLILFLKDLKEDK